MGTYVREYSAEHIANALDKATQSSDGWVSCCPAHDDERPSLSINDSNDGKILVRCHAGCSQKTVIEKLKELGLWPDTGKVCTTYDYVDANGNLQYQVLRFKDKKFVHRRPDGHGGWFWNMDGVEKLPYRLPELIRAINAGETIFIVEGEKDCESLAKLGFVATTNSGGAGKWKDELSKHLTGAKEVFILPDNDEVGYDHAHDVAASLSKLGIAVKIVPLPNLPPKGDVSDWLAVGGTKEQLLDLCAAASYWNSQNNESEAKDSSNENHKEPSIDLEVPAGFIQNQQGIFKIKKDSEDLVCGPLRVTALTHSQEATDWGMVLQFIDRDGNLREHKTLCKRLYEKDNSLIVELGSLGLLIVPGKEQYFKQYLAAYVTEERLESVDKLGWYETKDGLNFILPTESINCTGNESIIFQPEKHNAAADTMQIKGTLLEWQQEIAGLCSGQPYLIFSLATGLASPLLKPANMDSFGIHIAGPSSRGKTTAIQVAASVWGNGSDPATNGDNSYIRKWNSTVNALEGLCAARNDLPLIMDELGTGDGKDFGKLIYNIFGGQGKAAMTANRDLRQQRSWRNIVVSTGEISIKQKMDEARLTLRAGQQVRFLDVRVSGDIIKSEDAATLANELKQRCSQYYGTAGPEFIKRLITGAVDWLTLSALVNETVNCSVAQFKFDGANQEQARAIRRFALIEAAGILAVQLGVLPFTEEEIKQAVQVVLNDWLKEVQLLSDVEKGIESVQNFILSYRESRFKQITDKPKDNSTEDSYEPMIRDIAGYLHEPTGEFWFTSEGFKEACGGYNNTEVARGLHKKGLLIKDEPDRFNSKRTLPENQKQVRLYIIDESILELDQTEVNCADSNAKNKEAALA